jgi:chromatin remodeling complex protein RSC6
MLEGKLRKVFGKDKVTRFKMNKHLAQHLEPRPRFLAIQMCGEHT